jgi:hypothetical protein
MVCRRDGAGKGSRSGKGAGKGKAFMVGKKAKKVEEKGARVRKRSRTGKGPVVGHGSRIWKGD